MFAVEDHRRVRERVDDEPYKRIFQSGYGYPSPKTAFENSPGETALAKSVE